MRRALTASLLLAAAPALAHQPPPAGEIRVERIAPGIAVLFGRGGNIGVSYGADGNILIDDQYAPATARVVAAVATLDADPIRYVLNTHWHGDLPAGTRISAAPARSSSPTTMSASACRWRRWCAARRCRPRPAARCR